MKENNSTFVWIFYESYKPDYLPDNTTLEIDFNRNRKIIGISYCKYETELYDFNNQKRYDYTYNVDEKTLTYSTNDPEDPDNNKDFLYDIFLKDWFDANSSVRFSLDSPGEYEFIDKSQKKTNRRNITMKIFLQTTALFIMLCIMTTCGIQNTGAGEKDDRVNVAIDALNEIWDDYQIKNTRIITLKENNVEMFSDIDYIVEFVLYTDYFGSAPYYSNAGMYDTVSVYKDGHAEINARNLFDIYRSKGFVTDFSDIIELVNDLGAAYNN